MSGNPTVYSSDYGVTLLAMAGPVTLQGSSVQLSASNIIAQGALTLNSGLTVSSGTTALQATNTRALTATTISLSGSLTAQQNATVQGVLQVQGASNLASTLTVSGGLTAASTTTLQGALTCVAAATLQSTLAVSGNSTLNGTLSVAGATTFGASVTFNSNVSYATNTSVTVYNQTVQNLLSVQNKVRALSTLTRPLELANSATDPTQTVEVYFDRTSVGSTTYGTVGVLPNAGLVLTTAGKSALTASLVDQQITVSSNRQGDTFRVAGAGGSYTNAELFLDNSATQAAQVARVGCDASGLYFSPGSNPKAVSVDLSGKLNITKGCAVLGGLTSDSISAPSVSAGALATTTLSCMNTLTVSSIKAATSNVLALAGSDPNQTVSAPLLQSSYIKGATGTAVTITGQDGNSSTIVQGRLQVDTLATNAASLVTCQAPFTSTGTLTAPSTNLASATIKALTANNPALLTWDASVSNASYVATLGFVPSTSMFQLSVNSNVLCVINPTTRATTYNNAVTLQSTVSVAGSLTTGSTVAVGGASTYGGTQTPTVSQQYDIGSSTLQWRTGYFSASLSLPNAVFTGKLSELTPDLLNLQGPQTINYNNVRGLVIKSTNSTASSTADIVFDRSAINNAQVGGIGMGGDSQGLFLSTNGVQRLNISTTGLVGIGTLSSAPLTLAASTTASAWNTNGLYVVNTNATSTSGSPQNAIVAAAVQSLNNSANAYFALDNTQASWSLGMRGGDSKLYFSPTRNGPVSNTKVTLDQNGNATFAGGLLVADGTATTPAYGFATDTNNQTGFYHPAQGQIGVITNGLQSAQFNADKSVSIFGNLGCSLGVTAASLNITGSSSLSTLTVNNNTTLSGKLTVSGVTSTFDHTITSATDSVGMLRLIGTSATQTEASVYFNRSGTGTIYWRLGHGAFNTTDDFTIGGGDGRGACFQISQSNGYVTMRNNYGTSDEREKKNIRGCPLGLDFLLRTRPVEYQWKAGTDDKRHLGFTAQSIQELIPDYGVVISNTTAEGERLALSYTELIAPLVQAVKELAARVKELEAR